MMHHSGDISFSHIRVQDALMSLLRAGLWNIQPDSLQLFPLSSCEWQMVYKVSREQAVSALVFHGAMLLPEEFQPALEITMKWAAYADRVEQNNRVINKALHALNQLLGDIGVRPVLLKGQSSALLYDTPHLRECGDIDLYLESDEDLKRTLAFLRKENFEPKYAADGSYTFTFMGVYVELHRTFIDLSSPFASRKIKALKQQYGFTMPTSPDAVEMPVLSPMLAMLLLNTHILKHAMGNGIGLRQLCDMARACHAYHGIIGKDEMREACISLGIDKWSRLLHHFMYAYLALPIDELPYGEKADSADELFGIIISGGNFGMYAGRDAGDAPRSRKAETFKSFFRNLGFSFRCAGMEPLWAVLKLAAGQVKGWLIHFFK